MKGTVKIWFQRKGYGFIQGEDGNDYFVHHSALPEGTFFRQGDQVSFDAGEGRDGRPAAKNVKLLQKGSETPKTRNSKETYDEDEEE